MGSILIDGASVQSNFKNLIDGISLLEQIKNESLKVIFFDPQYRGVLDKMQYGNEGKSRGMQRSALPQMSEAVIVDFLKEIERVLIPSGYLFLWVDKFHLVEGIKTWFEDLSLNAVDMVTWNKMKMGMGYRTRRQAEYLVVLQKSPQLAKTTWRIHNIPDVWNEKREKNHPHAKPIELQKQLILATTDEGDYICDPASGGYSVFEACRLSGRNFIGGDIQFGDRREEVAV